MDGTKIAELVFPSMQAPFDDVVLQLLPGIKLNKEQPKEELPRASTNDLTRRQKIHRWLLSQRTFLANRQMALPDSLQRSNGRDARINGVAKTNLLDNTKGQLSGDPSILSYIPAIQHGSVPLVTERLQTYLDKRGSN